MTHSPEWSAVGWTMLHFLWVGTALGLMMAIGRRALRLRSPDAQYVYAVVCLAILAVTPIGIGTWIFWDGADVVAATPNSEPLSEVDFPGEMPPAWRIPSVIESPSARLTIVSDPHAPRASELLKTIAEGLPWIWLIGAPLVFLLTAIGFIGAERLRGRACVLTEGPTFEACSRSLRLLGMTRRVALGVCDQIASPILLGIVRPLILLPMATYRGWTQEQLEMALLRELAHIRRWDNLINLVQRLIEFLLFFHPMIWIVSRWVRQEREHCCDLFVVRITNRPRAYVETLLAMAEQAPIAEPCSQPLAARTGLAMAASDLTERARRILRLKDDSMKLSRLAFLTTALILMAPICWVAAFAEIDPPPSPDNSKNYEVSTAKRLPEIIAFTRQIPGQTRVNAQDLKHAAEVQAALGNRAEAREILKKLVERQFQESSNPFWIWQIGAKQIELGFVDDGRETLVRTLRAAEAKSSNSERVLVKSPNVFSMASGRIEILKVVAQSARQLKDDQLLAEIRHQLEKIKAEFPDKTKADQALVGLMAAVGDIDGAFQVAKEMASRFKFPFQESVFLVEIAEVASWLEPQVARLVLERLLKRLDQISPPVGHRNFVLEEIAQAQAKTGDFEQALRTAKMIGVPQADQPKILGDKTDCQAEMAAAMTAIAWEQRQAGQRDGAAKTLHETVEVLKTSDSPRMWVQFEQTAEGQIALGDWKSALRTIRLAPQGQRGGTLIEIALVQQYGGDHQGALQTLREATTDVNYQSDNFKTTAKAQQSFMGSPFASGNPDAEAEWKAACAMTLAKIQTLEGNLVAARKTAEGISIKTSRDSAFYSVGEALGSQEDTEKTFAWINEIPSPQDRAWAAKGALFGLLGQTYLKAALKSASANNAAK